MGGAATYFGGAATYEIWDVRAAMYLGYAAIYMMEKVGILFISAQLGLG